MRGREEEARRGRVRGREEEEGSEGEGGREREGGLHSCSRHRRWSCLLCAAAACSALASRHAVMVSHNVLWPLPARAARTVKQCCTAL